MRREATEWPTLAGALEHLPATPISLDVNRRICCRRIQFGRQATIGVYDRRTLKHILELAAQSDRFF
jgi:hypothetical protein